MSIKKLTLCQQTVEILVDGRMTVQNACVYLGIGPDTLARLRKNGDGPMYIKFDRRVFYYKDDLDAWIESKQKRRKID
jgi:excisionase family DNA binding protein